MSLTDASNRSFIGLLASEAGVTFSRARDMLSSPGSMLTNRIFPAAVAATLLNFSITNAAADTHKQLNAHMNGTADGLVSGFNFGSGQSGFIVIQKESDRRHRDTLNQISLGLIMDAEERAIATKAIVEQILSGMADGDTSVKREDVDACIRDYMQTHYEFDEREDPLMQEFHEDIRRQLESDHQIQIVLIQPRLQASCMDLTMA